jgi:hypothetical protein
MLKTALMAFHSMMRLNSLPMVTSLFDAVIPTAPPSPTRRAAALTLAVAGSLLVAAPASAVSPAQIVKVIDAERLANGLPAVREDPALSAGCADYDRYRQMNGSIADGFTPGREDPSKPGYTAAGSRASRDSLLNAGDLPGDSFANGDVFDDAPNHLVALMDPAVRVIGADQRDFDAGAFFGTASLTCIDVRSAPSRPKPRRLRTYTYVGPDGKAPRNPVYREGPSGSSPFVFLYFAAPKRTTVTLESLTFHHRNGTRTKPSVVMLSGGLRDGRRRAKAAISKHAAASPTPTVETRDPPEDGETADDLDWLAGLRRDMSSHAVERTGQAAVSFQWR